MLFLVNVPRFTHSPAWLMTRLACSMSSDILGFRVYTSTSIPDTLSIKGSLPCPLWTTTLLYPKLRSVWNEISSGNYILTFHARSEYNISSNVMHNLFTVFRIYRNQLLKLIPFLYINLKIIRWYRSSSEEWQWYIFNMDASRWFGA